MSSADWLRVAPAWADVRGASQACKFHQLGFATAVLAVNVLDRFLSLHPVKVRPAADPPAAGSAHLVCWYVNLFLSP